MVRPITIKDLSQLIRKVYRGNPVFKDNKTGLLKIVSNPEGAFYRLTSQEVVGSFWGDELCAASILIRHRNNPDTLMIAFFEALPERRNQFVELMEYAVKYAQKQGAKNVIAGLDGHPDYSLGFLSSHFDAPPSFGQSFNPDYYPKYFEEAGFKAWKMVSFQGDLERIPQDFFGQINGFSKNMRLQQADFKTKSGFRKTMKLYNALGNESFAGHPFYFPRLFEEDYELFASMRPLLANENLLFADVNGRPAGFLLWYHDFNELTPKGKGAGIATLLKLRLLKKFPETVKLVEIGVLPQYRNSGVVQYLFQNAYQIIRSKYPSAKYINSGWILENNKISKKISAKILPQESKRQVFYELDVAPVVF